MADVKFSELTALGAAEVNAADIFAVVDTSASTSKKLSVENLFGAVPVDIRTEDTSNATSTTTGSIQTDGGIGVAKALYVGQEITTANMDFIMGAASAATTTTLRSTASSSGKVLTLPNVTDTVVTRTTTDTLTNKTLTTPVIASLQQASGTNTLTMPAATDTLVGKATTDTLTNKTLTAPKFADAGFIADANGAELLVFQTTSSAENHFEITNAADAGGPTFAALGDDTNVDMLLTAKGSGVVKADGTEVVTLTGSQTLTNKTLTTPTVSGLTLSDASIVLEGATADAYETTITVTDPTADRTITIPNLTGTVSLLDGTETLSNKTLTSPLVTTKVQASTDGGDVTLNQYDGIEVARVTDGATAVSGFTLVQTAKGGFGYKRQVLHVAMAATDSVLTTSQSGALIRIAGSGTGVAQTITLPAIASDAEVGVWYEFIVTTALHSSDTCKIRCSGHAGSTDGFHLFMHTADDNALGHTAFSAGNDILTLPNSTPIGTRVIVTSVVGGSNEQWLARAETNTVDIAVGTS